ncbi:hypothetical protein [Parafilimonas sp.]|uniref:hypothetical protein n=1 Tax=Parafilimonas sp. TaxID=1969739 RepID=UPI0039E2B8C1
MKIFAFVNHGKDTLFIIVLCFLLLQARVVSQATQQIFTSGSRWECSAGMYAVAAQYRGMGATAPGDCSPTWTGLESTEWNNGNNWCSGTVPTSASNVLIPLVASGNYPVISTVDAAVASITISSGASLIMSGIYNLTISAGGSFSNSGVFNATGSTTGAVVFGGSGAIAGSATTTFNNITSNGPLVLTTAPVITGIFTINDGLVTGNAPTYGSSSTLIYNAASYTTGVEWSAGAASTTAAGAGIPQNITIQKGMVAIPDALGANRAVAGNLTINPGATLQMTAGSRDLYILGNWTNNGGTFTANGRTVDFNATGTSSVPVTQTIAGATTFYNLRFGNSYQTTAFGTSVTTVTNQFNDAATMDGGISTVILTGSAGTIIGTGAKRFYNLQINSGASINHKTGGGLIHIANSFINNGSLTENDGYTLYFDKTNATETFSGTGTNHLGNLVIGDNGYSFPTTLDCAADFTINGGSMVFYKSSVYNGNGNTATFSTAAATISGTGTAGFYNAVTNVELNPGSGISIIHHYLQINPGGSVVVNAPGYESASTLIYNTTASLLTGMEWNANSATAGVGQPFNVTVQNANNVAMAGDRTVPGTLTINAGNTLVLNGRILIVNTAITGDGTLTGSDLSGLVLNGSAPDLKFTPGAYNDYLKTFTINSTGSATLANSLNIAAGTYTSPGVLTANGPLGTAGFLTLKSNANGDARIGISSGAITGEATVERYIPARRAWRFLTAPFQSTDQTINEAWQEGYTNTSLVCPVTEGAPTGIGTGIAYINGYEGYDYHNTNSPSLQYWNGTAWAAPASTKGANKLTDHPAWYIFIRGDRQICLNGINGSNETVIRAKGELNQLGGTNVKTWSEPWESSSYYMAANPYASPVSLRNIIDGANGSSGYYTGKIWVMDPKLTNLYGVGGYVAYTPDAGWVPNDPVRQSVSYAAGDDPVIQSGQGFMVYTSSTNPVIKFRESDKVSDEWNVFGITAKTWEPAKKPVIYTNLMQSDSVTVMDGVAAVFGTGFSSDVDEKDVQKLWNMGENMAIMRREKALAVEKRPGIKRADTLFYRLYVKQEPYVLKIFSLHFTPQQLPDAAWLVDKYLDTQTKIDLTQETLYRFVPDTDTNSYRNRFMLVFKPMPSKWPPVIDTLIKKIKVKIFPNPVSGTTFKLVLDDAQSGNYVVHIYTGGSRLIASCRVNDQYGKNSFSIAVPAAVTAGVYIVQVMNEEGLIVGSAPMVISR